MRMFLRALLVLLLLAQAVPLATAQDASGVATLTGSLTLANPVLFATSSEPYVLLTDMTAYVQRDRTRPLPLNSQIAAPFQGDLTTGAAFALHLPIAPEGMLNDLSHGTARGKGVQIYSVDLEINLIGEPFVDPIEAAGWSTELSSIITEIATGEVVGGEVVVWAPDDGEVVPTGLGPDGRFLTADDPLGPVPAGWTVIDLSTEPFAQVRTSTAEVTIVEGDDGYSDYSGLSYTDAFDTLLDDLQQRYVYTDLKGIDWTQLRATFRPRVQRAEATHDVDAFNQAIFELGLAFHDGHVAANPPQAYIDARTNGRLGMRLAETEAHDVIVTSVTSGFPADRAGIADGAVIATWNGKPTADAVKDVPIIDSVSTEIDRRIQQFELLPLGRVGDTVSLAFQNPGGRQETAKLTFVEDTNGDDAAAQVAALRLGDYDPAELPVVAHLLPTGIGYIRINSFFADPILMSTAWDYALNTLHDLGALGLVIDVRHNGGGEAVSALYLAGSFTDTAFTLDQAEMLDAQGLAVTTGSDVVAPSPVRWDAPTAVLIDTGCASACEIFVAAMAHDPGHQIVGYTPTAGTEGGVYFWDLPGNVSFQAPVIRLVKDGAVFLEGTGVAPTVRVRATSRNLLGTGDAALITGMEALAPAIRANLAAGTPAPATPPVASPIEASPAAPGG